MGRTWVLIATDLIGRGMDFLGVNTVVSAWWRCAVVGELGMVVVWYYGTGCAVLCCAVQGCELAAVC